jgi:hypothetical protein
MENRFLSSVCVAGVPCICIGPSHVFLFGDFIFAVVIAGFVLHRFRLSIRVQVLERINLVQLFCYGRPVRRVQARDFSLLEHRISAVISFSFDLLRGRRPMQPEAARPARRQVVSGFFIFACHARFWVLLGGLRPCRFWFTERCARFIVPVDFHSSVHAPRFGALLKFFTSHASAARASVN